MTGQVLTDSHDGVAVLTVSDPDRRNALSMELSEQLARAVADCEADESVGALVVTGAPPAFCAGADFAALSAAGESGDPAQLHRLYGGFLAVARCALPTVAAVAGPAIGAGFNLALACDVRLAGGAARFDARFLQLGIHPGGGMTWMLQRAVGPQTAAAMTLFSEVLDASEAVRTGLAYRLVDTSTAGDDRAAGHSLVLQAAIDLAARAAAARRELVTATKHSLRDTAGMTEQAAAVEREVTPQIGSVGSAELDPRGFTERVEQIRSRHHH